MADNIPEPRLFTGFGKYDEFKNLQDSLLAVDIENEPTLKENADEEAMVSRLRFILDEYQEQAYLIDPHLEKLLPPVAEVLRSHAKMSVSEPSRRYSTARIGRVSQLLYHYIKFRGYKTAIRYLPHEIADVSIMLDYMRKKDCLARAPYQWPLRHVILLWIALICMIPFDLAQFDPPDKVGQTADSIESLGMEFIGAPGVERDSAAVLLARFFTRKDCANRYNLFVNQSVQTLKESDSVFTAVGILSVLSEVVKSGAAEQTESNVDKLFQVVETVQSTSRLGNNSVVRKLLTKLRVRIVLRFLPPKTNRRRRKGVPLGGGDASHPGDETQDVILSEYVTDLVEGVLEQLFSSLQDKDTIIRWTSAKGVARISERLPTDFSAQVLDTVVELFSVHSVAAATMYDMPSIAEMTWHGACLGCAEMARRGLVPPEKLSELMSWLPKALNFDIRKGAHSIGSNVRDAAAYVLWALARTQDAVTLKPHAVGLAGALVTASLFDREVHIRRAASAAFQEHVGRMSLLPHGIDVLRKTDFYAVSLRRHAFLVAAPQVAEHIEYRQGLVDHLLRVTLRHWDPSMRQLGAESLRLICKHDLIPLGTDVIKKAAHLLESTDVNDVHGGLLALIEITVAYKEAGALEGKASSIFGCLAIVPSTIVLGTRNGLVTAAACKLISVSITQEDINLREKSVVPKWQDIVDFGLKHRSEDVQDAAAGAMGAISGLTKELQKGAFTKQQSLGRLLGIIDYKMNPKCLQPSIECLLKCVDRSSSPMKMNIEARRNCYSAIPQVLTRLVDQRLSPENFSLLFDALLDGLNDYTMDERGDVGSWIRIVCMQGLETFIQVAFHSSGAYGRTHLRPAQFHEAIGGILKQGVERLDNVRQVAGEVFDRLFKLEDDSNSEEWNIEGKDVFRKRLYNNEVESAGGGWRESALHFPRAVYWLDIARYRGAVLPGLLSSIGSRTEITQRYAGASLVQYVQLLPVHPGEGTPYCSLTLVDDLISMAKPEMTSNNVIIPILQAFNVLLEADALTPLARDSEGADRLGTLLAMTSRNVQRLKNVQRVTESMKLVCQLLPFEPLYTACSGCLDDFLAHPFPKVRTETAEYLYVVLQTKDMGKDTDEMEEILLETDWNTEEEAGEARIRLINLLKGEE